MKPCTEICRFEWIDFEAAELNFDGLTGKHGVRRVSIEGSSERASVREWFRHINNPEACAGTLVVFGAGRPILELCTPEEPWQS